MKREIVIVFDCGATNVRAVAVESSGKILASSGFPNSPSPQKGKAGYLVWDLEILWKKLCLACKKVISQIDCKNIRAVTVTTFGADGAPVDRKGNLTYPVISWQCPRTLEIANRLTARTKLAEKIYRITGYQIISFNTILKLMWLKENAPRALENAKCWLMMPGLLTYKLCSEFSIDPTIGSTTMAMDIKHRRWSEEILGMAGINSSFFPEWVQPGEITGKVSGRASMETGLPQGIPVIACGHDTQFALHGCGAQKNEAILSTGTWEILMVQTDKCSPDKTGFEGGLIFECDAVPGYWNPQILMMGSGVIEWVRRNFYCSNGNRKDIYRLMISEGKKVSPGANGIVLIPSFKPDTGPFRKYNIPGALLGLSLSTDRADIYRAAIEGLSFQLKRALEILTSVTGFKPEALRVVGGGAKNDLWNQIRADVTGLPVTVTEQKEATVLGASLFAFKGAGIYNSIEEAKKHFKFIEHLFRPSKNRKIYKRVKWASNIFSGVPFNQALTRKKN